MRVELQFRFSKFDPRRTQWHPRGEPVRLPERRHQGSRSASPAREMSSRGRATSRCKSTVMAARLRRVARSSAWPAAVSPTTRDGERRGWSRAQGGPFEAITCAAVTIRPCRRWNAAATPTLPVKPRRARTHGTWATGRLSRMRVVSRSLVADPSFSAGARAEQTSSCHQEAIVNRIETAQLASAPLCCRGDGGGSRRACSKWGSLGPPLR